MSDVARVLRTSFVASLFVAVWGSAAAAEGTDSFAGVIDSVQPKVVKIFGAGGLRGLEAYQSGFLVSAEGHVLTVWSYVLDTDYVTVTLDDGRRFTASLVGADPRAEIAVLKIEADQLPHFGLHDTVELSPGDRVFAFSNLFGVAVGDEAASVMHGTVTARCDLAARRGAFATNFSGSVYVLDAITNNPGAAGGALVDRRGRLAGMLGKELRNAATGTWLNHAIPIAQLVAPVEEILAGRTPARSGDDNESVRKPAQPWTPSLLGLRMVPDVLARTPPFVDTVLPGSPAAVAGLQPDDLVLFVGDVLTPSISSVRGELALRDRIDPIRLIVQRGRELVDVTIPGR